MLPCHVLCYDPTLTSSTEMNYCTYNLDLSFYLFTIDLSYLQYIHDNYTKSRHKTRQREPCNHWEPELGHIQCQIEIQFINIQKYMDVLFTDWEVRVEKIFSRGLRSRPRTKVDACF